MALVTTPGAANANSYADVTEADAFMLGRPQSEAWIALTTAQKEAALMWSTLLLDAAFVWTGSAVDAVQYLSWPRNGMLSRNGFPIGPTTIPGELKAAQIEFARQLALDDKAADNDPIKQGITSIKAGSVALTFKSESTPSSIEILNANIRMMGPDFYYLSKTIPDAVKMFIVPSWYVRRTASQPFVFGVHR